MRTRLTELFGIQHPILLAGMGRASVPKLVAEISNAGGLGVFGSGSSPPAVTRQAIRDIRALTDKPFGANVPLSFPNGMENAHVLLEEKVPIINYSLGKGDWIVKRAREYGGKVMASVTSVHLAQRAEAHGVDAVIAAGFEAAGHGADTTLFVLVPRLAEVLKIPIIAAGGIATGAQLTAALALGASGVSMGTRFLVSKESPVHPNFKKKVIESEISDTWSSERFDGSPSRLLKTGGSERALKNRMDLWQILLSSFTIARDLDIPYLKLLRQVLFLGPEKIVAMMRMSQMVNGWTIALTTGDLERGMMASGMSAGLVHEELPAAEIIEKIMAEAEASQRSMPALDAA